MFCNFKTNFVTNSPVFIPFIISKIDTQVCENVCRLLKCMVSAARVGVGSHVCAMKVKQVSECAFCEASVMWYQLSTKLVQFIAPENPVRPPDVSVFSLFNAFLSFNFHISL